MPIRFLAVGSNTMNERQKYIAKISRTIRLIMGWIIRGKAHKALGLVKDLERDIVELRKVENS